MTFRSTILILCIVSQYVVAVSPSCAGYYAYSNFGRHWRTALTIPNDAEIRVRRAERRLECMASTGLPRRVEVSAAARVSLEAETPRTIEPPTDYRHVAEASDWLALSHRTTFLRLSVLLI